VKRSHIDAARALNAMDVNEDFVDIAKSFIDNGVELAPRRSWYRQADPRLLPLEPSQQSRDLRR
jgi:hypothetical protein